MGILRISVAGYVAEVCTSYQISPSLYKDFRINKESDFRIELGEKDICTLTTENRRRAVVKFTNILKLMAESLLVFDVMLMHGCVVATDGHAYLFTAPSRIGKTTHMELWLDNLPDAFVVNGDKPFIKFPEDGSQPLACGSPWAGKENLYTNTMVPLKAIICMERAEKNSIHEISFAEAFPFLLQQTYRPEDEDLMRKTLHLLQRLKGKVKFYKFYCNNFADDCFDVAYKALAEDG